MTTHPHQSEYRVVGSIPGCRRLARLILHRLVGYPTLMIIVATSLLRTQNLSAQQVHSTPADVLRAAKEAYDDTNQRGKLTRAAVQERSKQGHDTWFDSFKGKVDRDFKLLNQGSLKRTEKQLWSVKGIAQPGDIIQIVSRPELDQIRVFFTAVYVGEEAFPDQPDKVFSFFIYPYRTKLECNTLPARIHDQYVDARKSSLPDNSFQDLAFPESAKDVKRHVTWARTSGASRSVFLKTNLFDVAQYDFRLFRARNRFQGFEGQQEAFEKDVRRAIELNSKSVVALKGPADGLSAEVKKLLLNCFKLTKVAESELTVIRGAFEANAKALELARFVYPRTKEEVAYVKGEDFVAATKSAQRLIYIDPDYYYTRHKYFKPATDNAELHRASVLLHEGMHIVHPITADEAGASYAGHWGGVVPIYVREPKDHPDNGRLTKIGPVGVEYADAKRNPYCYQLFAVWLETGAAK